MSTACPATAAPMAAHRSGSSTSSTVWVTPSSSTVDPSGAPGSVSSSVSPGASDSPQIGERLAPVAAGELEPVGRVLGCRPFVREHALPVRRLRILRCDLQRADDPDGAPGPSGLVGEGHAVEREGRALVGLQDAVVLPLLEGERRALVATRPLGLRRHVDPHDVGGMAAGQLLALAAAEDVVGRRHDVVEVHLRGVVAQTDERLEAGHGRQGWHAVMAASSP